MRAILTLLYHLFPCPTYHQELFLNALNSFSCQPQYGICFALAARLVFDSQQSLSLSIPSARIRDVNLNHTQKTILPCGMWLWTLVSQYHLSHATFSSLIKILSACFHLQDTIYLSYCSVAMKRHYYQGNSYSFIGAGSHEGQPMIMQEADSLVLECQLRALHLWSTSSSRDTGLWCRLLKSQGSIPVTTSSSKHT